MRARWLDPLVDWITAAVPEGGHRRILDLGCGDLLLGSLLDPAFRVDGYDPVPGAGGAAPPASVVYEGPEQIPDDTYDLVVINSVLQYASSLDDAGEILAVAARALRPEGFGILVVDLPLGGVHVAPELRDLIRFLFAVLPPTKAADLLVRTARHRPRRPVAMRRGDLDRLAATLGLRVELLPANLSRLRSRSSVLLVPIAGGLAP